MKKARPPLHPRTMGFPKRDTTDAPAPEPSATHGNPANTGAVLAAASFSYFIAEK
jgi:hypothetical protein